MRSPREYLRASSSCPIATSLIAVRRSDSCCQAWSQAVRAMRTVDSAWARRLLRLPTYSTGQTAVRFPNCDSVLYFHCTSATEKSLRSLLNSLASSPVKTFTCRAAHLSFARVSGAKRGLLPVPSVARNYVAPKTLHGAVLEERNDEGFRAAAAAVPDSGIGGAQISLSG
jgi:hypothetical protein